MNADQVIQAYIHLRNKKEEMQTLQKTQLAPLNEQLDKLEAWLLNKLQTEGLTNLKSATGTAFTQVSTSVTCSDWAATLAWIKEHNAWEFRESRVSKSVVQEFIENNDGEAPPGVKVTREVEVRVRKS
jgi:hypothetical protein